MLLGALCHGDKKDRTAIVRTADKQLVKCICEYVLNVLQGVIKLSDNTKRQLSRHQYVLRKLVTPIAWETLIGAQRNALLFRVAGHS